ncbi:hypothetical protein [Chryseobacterium sp. Leaf405]|nr:hypothetical protein [Chryseobacterium sp. Leaf405]
MSADLSQIEGAKKVVTEVLSTFGRLDILVNNLGSSVSFLMNYNS